ncbi:MAG: hypothetical protein OXI33_05320 [Chloroflexota bacterium]|nr:hypothetical protein [Chloroflexota bacterium]
MVASHLKHILDREALTPPAQEGRVRLRQANVMEVEVVELPPDATVISLEKLGRLSGLKKGQWLQTCDYLLVFSQGDQNQAVFVELKRTLDEEGSRAMEQLRRSLPLLDYLLSVCRVHFGDGASRIAVRYLLIGQRRRAHFDKRPSVSPDPERNLRTQEYKNITVSTFVGARFPLDFLPRAART